jgi:hypothetical protein
LAEPHPRFYTDPTDSARHRPNEPFAHFTVIPEECDFELIKMSDDEAAERELQAWRIYESRAWRYRSLWH